MRQPMDPWKFESNSRKQAGLSLACLVVGIILALGFRLSSPGFVLGLLLLLIGIAALVIRGKQTIVIDPLMRQIVVVHTNQFGSKTRVIPFAEIAHALGYLGKRSGVVAFYYINLQLKSGEQFPLFSPGRFFEGGSARSVMDDRRHRLEELIKQPVV